MHKFVSWYAFLLALSAACSDAPSSNATGDGADVVGGDVTDVSWDPNVPDDADATIIDAGADMVAADSARPSTRSMLHPSTTTEPSVAGSLSATPC